MPRPLIGLLAMGKINSRTKGASYERELAQDLREAGWSEAKRGCQHAGGADSPDVVGLPGWHIEAKRVESFNLHKAMEQAERDRGLDQHPLVVHRRNKGRSVAILDWKTFLALLAELEAMKAAKGRPPGSEP
jgi:hypothetical protein